MPDPSTPHTYKKGDRVRLRLDEYTHRVWPKNRDREGTVVGTRSQNVWCVTVLWDGLKPSSRQSVHINFLEPTSIPKREWRQHL